MMSLFSVFDPISYFGLGLNWLVMIIMFLVFPLGYYKLSSVLVGGLNNIEKMTELTFKEISKPNYMGLGMVAVMVFLYLVVTNMMGLFPFIFTSSAHPVMTLGWGLVFWGACFLMGWLKNFKHSAAHLVPEGSPLGLSPIMVIIESISHLMRPFTLSIRLAANMMAGHLIIGLLASISLTNVFGFFSSMLMQSILLVLEFGVSVIQGFVFSILVLLYALEYY